MVFETSNEMRRRTGQRQPLLSDIVCAKRLKLFGHVAQADKSQDHSRALRACIWHSSKNWKRRLGRPRHTWLRTAEADLRPFNLGLASGFKKAQDRTTWRALTGTATSPTSPEWWWWTKGKNWSLNEKALFAVLLLWRPISNKSRWT